MTDRTLFSTSNVLSTVLSNALSGTFPHAKHPALRSLFPFAAFLTAGTAAGLGLTALLALLGPADCAARTTDVPAQPEYRSILPFLEGYAYTGDPDGVPDENAATPASAREESSNASDKVSNDVSNAVTNPASETGTPEIPEGSNNSNTATPAERNTARSADRLVKNAPARETENLKAPSPQTAVRTGDRTDADGASEVEPRGNAPAARESTDESADESAALPTVAPDRASEPAFRSAPHAEGPFVRRRETTPSLVFHISPYQTSRLAIEGERIASAIWDQADLTLEAESRTGEVYLLPKRLGRMQLYVTTDSGETAGITIVADERAEPENIVLERRTARETTERRTAPTRRLPALPASDFEGALKSFAATLARGEETPAVEKRPCVETQAVLHAREVLAALSPKSQACYAARGLFATRIRIRNRSIRPVLVRESALLAPQVLAVTAEKPVLSAGESTVLHIIEATHD